MGHAACDEKLLQADINKVRDDPNGYWIGGGDFIDAIARKNDKRASQNTLAPWCSRVDDVIKAQLDRFEELVTPIASKCLALLLGNHELDVLERDNRDVYAHEVDILGRAMGLPKDQHHKIAPGWEGFIDLRFRYNPPGGQGAARKPDNMGHNWRFIIWSHHGFGGGRKAGGHALTLESAMGNYEADLILMGHRHVRVATSRDLVCSDVKHGYKIRQRWGAYGGSYLGAYLPDMEGGQARHNYPQRKGLPARATGGVVVDIKPYEHEFGIVLNGHLDGGGGR